MISTKQIDFNNYEERILYSQKLKDFEKEFTYPLGDKFFTIEHGIGEGHDYFSFFEQLGDLHCFVLEQDNKVIGVVCAVLRKINNQKNQKIWYLCDFKISKAFRGQKLYKKLMMKYFLFNYFKCSKMYALNMSPAKGNKLLNHTQHIFKVFNVESKPLYLHTLDGEDVKVWFENEAFRKDYVIALNNGNNEMMALWA